MDDLLETNKAIVRSFFDLAFHQKRPEEAAARYMAPSYRQHNPAAGDGPEQFIAYAHVLEQSYPQARFDIKRQVAEGDLVVQHSHLIREPGDRGQAVMDIFRIENGKLAEHWDVIQDVAETSANDNTMF